MKSSHEVILYILLKTNQPGLRKLYYGSAVWASANRTKFKILTAK